MDVVGRGKIVHRCKTFVVLVSNNEICMVRGCNGVELYYTTLFLNNLMVYKLRFRLMIRREG